MSLQYLQSRWKDPRLVGGPHVCSGASCYGMRQEDDGRERVTEDEERVSI